MSDPYANCTDVTPQCPVEATTYGYAPSLGWNAFFAAWFGIACIVNIILGIRFKTWTFMIALGFGTLGECIGYIGRVIMHNNAWSNIGFEIQICCIIIAPAFISAGMYLTLKHLVINFGTEWSRLRPNWYTWIFICGDLLSLVLQGAGGGIAATADHGSSAQDMGTDLMIAGIIWQVVCLSVFGILLTEYGIRTRRRQSQLSTESIKLIKDTKFRLFLGAIFVAYWTILIRCIYRIPELTGGWGNDIMRNEPEFIVLEGVMIAVAAAALTIFHPGFCFPALGANFYKPVQQKTMSEDGLEMMQQRV